MGQCDREVGEMILRVNMVQIDMSKEGSEIKINILTRTMILAASSAHYSTRLTVQETTRQKTQWHQYLTHMEWNHPMHFNYTITTWHDKGKKLTTNKYL